MIDVAITDTSNWTKTLIQSKINSVQVHIHFDKIDITFQVHKASILVLSRASNFFIYFPSINFTTALSIYTHL
ncbi:MAG: hypothetical protein LBC61_06090 [Candidatus Peribacteria bacterium]|nr:hypothetical protein [Candidatus Peribacteria bacterium]